MANLQKYTKCAVYVNGNLLSEESEVNPQRMTNAQEVKTVAKGFAGMSEGSPMMKVAVTNAVPSADFELNPGPFMQGLEVVEFTFFAAGKTLTTKGFIIDDNFSHAVDTASKLVFNAVCQFADWA